MTRESWREIVTSTLGLVMESMMRDDMSWAQTDVSIFGNSYHKEERCFNGEINFRVGKSDRIKYH